MWKDNSGIEHGLIVSPSEIGEKAWSNVTSNIIGTSAQSLWDGLNNSIAIINQSGHTNSAAKFCLDLVLGDYNDWYLPSIDELSILWQNRFNVNKTLSTIVGGVIFSNEICEAEFSKYWSSTEYFQTMSWYFNFCSGAAINEQKINSYQVRAIRAF